MCSINENDIPVPKWRSGRLSVKRQDGVTEGEFYVFRTLVPKRTLAALFLCGLVHGRHNAFTWEALRST